MKWKQIKEFEEYYEVNDLGQVRRIGQISNRKKQITHKGYHKVFLYGGGKRLHCFVHRLVAIAFISNPENKPNINHKNGIKTDNRINNLEWCTTAENNQHAKEMKLYKPLHGSKHGMSALTEEIVLKIREHAKEGMTHKSIADFYGVTPSTIRMVIIGKSWKHV